MRFLLAAVIIQDIGLPLDSKQWGYVSSLTDRLTYFPVIFQNKIYGLYGQHPDLTGQISTSHPSFSEVTLKSFYYKTTQAMSSPDFNASMDGWFLAIGH